MRVLVVKSDFQGYTKGQIISDETAMAEIMAGESQSNVIAAEHPVAPVYAAPRHVEE